MGASYPRRGPPGTSTRRARRHGNLAVAGRPPGPAPATPGDGRGVRRRGGAARIRAGPRVADTGSARTSHRERRHMTTARRCAPALLAIALVALAALAAAGAGAAGGDGEAGAGAAQPGVRRGAARPAGRPRPGSPAQPGGGARGRGRRGQSRAHRRPASYDLRRRGPPHAGQGPGPWNTCWAFANIAALESKLMPAAPEPDFSEDNVVRRSGYFSTMDQRYDWGGYDFMAVAYFARWAGPVDESARPLRPRGRRQRDAQARPGRGHDPRPLALSPTTTSSSGWCARTGP